MTDPRPVGRGRAAARLAVVVVVAALVAGCSSTARHSTASSTTSGPGDGSGTTVRTADRHAEGPSAGCKAPPLHPGTMDLKLVSGGVPRSYELIVPPDYDGTKPFALVLGLHSLTVDYHVVPMLTGLADLQSRYDYIGVAPSGLLDGTVPYWNAAPVPHNGDVTFIGDLLDHLEATLCIDTGKVFSEGMSNGAQLSSLLACRMPDRLAGISPISGVEFNAPCSGAPVPIIAFHGTADPIVPYKGGGLNSVAIAGQDLYKGHVPAGTARPTGVQESMRRWAAHNGCDPKFTVTRVTPHVRLQQWHRCKARTEIYLVDGGGHAWPGRPQKAFEAQFGPGTTEIDATDLMFRFFLGAPRS